MGCALKQHGNSPYEFTSTPGKVTLKIVQPTPSGSGTVQFNSKDQDWSIQDQTGKNVNYTLTNNNQNLAFDAAQGFSYSLTLPYICTPSSCYGLLEEDCTASDLSLSLISVNTSVEISIVC
jgi:hypothetical protein